MNNETIKNFVTNLLIMWETGNTNMLSQLYHKSVMGHFHQLDYGFEEIKNRLLFIEKHHSERKFNLEDLLIEKNKFSLRFSYSAIDKESNQKIYFNSIGIYQLLDLKIIEVWLLSEQSIDYLKKP